MWLNKEQQKQVQYKLDEMQRKLDDAEDVFKTRCKYCNERKEWIPVSERLPSEQELEEHNKLFLVFTQDSEIPFIAYRFAHIWSDGCCALDVIAWQPLPQPYKEDK